MFELFSDLTFHGSTNDIITLRTKDDEKKKKGIFGFQWKRRSKAVSVSAMAMLQYRSKSSLIRTPWDPTIRIDQHFCLTIMTN